MQQSTFRKLGIYLTGAALGTGYIASSERNAPKPDSTEPPSPIVRADPSPPQNMNLDTHIFEDPSGGTSADSPQDTGQILILTTHKVKAGDTLGGLAHYYYRDSSRWVDIAKANGDLDSTRLKIGAVLNIPRLSLTDSIPNYPVPEAPQTREDSYTVQKGDTLSAIAEKKYNDASLWPELARANNIQAPYDIKIGQKLILPELDPKVRPGCPLPNPIQHYKPYIVQSGDNFRTIARKEYGDPQLARIIQEANPGVNNQSLQIGQIVRLPLAVAPAAPTKNETTRIVVDARISQNLAQRILDFLPPESRRALLAKLSLSTDRSRLYALVELACQAGTELSPQGIRSFQQSRGLNTDGVIGPHTAQALYRELCAQWYKELVHAHIKNCRWDEEAGKVNCVGLRGFDLHKGSNANTFNHWNDTIAFIWRDTEGRWCVQEYAATTDPGVRTSHTIPDVNGDNKGNPAWLITGRQYRYTPGSHRGRPGALVLAQAAVHRDLNNDGQITEEEQGESPVAGQKLNIHWGPSSPTNRVGRASYGCQVLQISYAQFLEEVTPLFKGQARVYYTLLDLSRPAASN